jgi:hypothetical protein
VSIALSILIASAEHGFESTTALLVGISLALNLFCFQVNARNAQPFGETKSDNQVPPVHVKLWPESKSPIGLDAKIENRIDGQLKQMTVEEKVGQVVQPEWKSDTRGRQPCGFGIEVGRSGRIKLHSVSGTSTAAITIPPS